MTETTQTIDPLVEKLTALTALAREFSAHEARLKNLERSVKAKLEPLGPEAQAILVLYGEIADTIFPLMSSLSIGLIELVEQAIREDETLPEALDDDEEEGSFLLADDGEFLVSVLVAHKTMVGVALDNARQSGNQALVGEMQQLMDQAIEAEEFVKEISLPEDDDGTDLSES